MIALIDCNNFFVSCERVFDPKLFGIPVVVLSSNDGCVISRSQEAKDVGIPMGAPYYQFKEILNKYKVKIFSSNFSLYADMSARVMDILSEFSDDLQVYSVDEAFLPIPKNMNEFKFGTNIRNRIKQYTGIPVSVGIASTKTLAKVANKFAKKDPTGVFIVNDKNNHVLETITAGEVWGIGGASSRKLLKYNIRTALDLQNVSDTFIQKTLGLGGLRIVHELQGISCIGIRDLESSKSIMSSRSFGKAVEKLADIEYAVGLHAAKAAEKMREEGNAARFLSVFIRTSKHADHYSYDSGSIELSFPIFDVRLLISEAKKILRTIYRPGFRYSKAGILLSNFVAIESVPKQTLFGDSGIDKQIKIMELLDSINQYFGRNTVFSAGAQIKNETAPKRQFISKHYTTNWNEILTISL